MEEIYAIADNVSITTHLTRFSDGDPAKIVYFANIPMYFDEGFIEIARNNGFAWGQRDNKFIIPIVEQKATYRNPLRVGTQYHVITAIIHVGNRSFKSGHIIYQESKGTIKMIAFGYIARAVVDPSTFTAIQMPENLEKVLKSHAVDQQTWQQIIDYFQKI